MHNNQKEASTADLMYPSKKAFDLSFEGTLLWISKLALPKN